MPRRHVRAEAAALGQQRQAAVHRAFGAVLLSQFGAERDQQAVAGVRHHLAAVRLHDAQPLELLSQRAERGGRHRIAELCTLRLEGGDGGLEGLDLHRRDRVG